jgi:hypothetical protein
MQPFFLSDREPLWLRAISLLARAAEAFSELSLVKIAWAVLTSAVFYATKVPFYFECLWLQRGARVRRDVAYGPRPRNKLDVYLPDPEVAAAAGHGKYGRAIIMLVHGGAWFCGDKLYFAKVQSASFPDCTVVAVNYTLHPHADCEQMLKDVSNAISWTVHNLPIGHAEEGSVGVPFVAVGHSAGAHLVMLCTAYRCLGKRAGARAAAVARRLAPWGWSPHDVKAVVGSAGIYHISEHFAHEKSRGVHNISPMCGNRRTVPPITTAGRAPPVMGLDPKHWEDWSPRTVVQAAFAAEQRGEPALRVHFERQTQGNEHTEASPSFGVPASSPSCGPQPLGLPNIVLVHGVRWCDAVLTICSTTGCGVLAVASALTPGPVSLNVWSCRVACRGCAHKFLAFIDATTHTHSLTRAMTLSCRQRRLFDFMKRCKLAIRARALPCATLPVPLRMIYC